MLGVGSFEIGEVGIGTPGVTRTRKMTKTRTFPQTTRTTLREGVGAMLSGKGLGYFALLGGGSVAEISAISQREGLLHAPPVSSAKAPRRWLPRQLPKE